MVYMEITDQFLMLMFLVVPNSSMLLLSLTQMFLIVSKLVNWLQQIVMVANTSDCKNTETCPGISQNFLHCMYKRGWGWGWGWG